MVAGILADDQRRIFASTAIAMMHMYTWRQRLSKSVLGASAMDSNISDTWIITWSRLIESPYHSFGVVPVKKFPRATTGVDQRQLVITATSTGSTRQRKRFLTTHRHDTSPIRFRARHVKHRCDRPSHRHSIRATAARNSRTLTFRPGVQNSGRGGLSAGRAGRGAPLRGLIRAGSRSCVPGIGRGSSCHMSPMK